MFGMGTGVTPPLWPPGNLLAAGTGDARYRALDGITPSQGAHVWGPSIPRGMACSRASFERACLGIDSQVLSRRRRRSGEGGNN